MPVKLLERDVVKQCTDWLTMRGYRCLRLNSGLVQNMAGVRMRLGEVGMPDWIALKGDKYVLIELKATGKQPSAEQLRWHAEARRQGLRVVWSDSLEGLMERIA